MKAVVFPGSGKIDLVEKPMPKPKPNEVIIAMKAAGVCGSDLHFLSASADEQRNSTLGAGLSRDPALTPGHEITGVVDSVGDRVTHLKVGDRVAVHHYSGCGTCRSCHMGWDTLCLEKEVYTLQRDGGFQDFVAAIAKNCVVIPDSVSFPLAAFISCGGGTSFQAIRRSELKAGETIASVGLGPVGLSGLLWAKSMGCQAIGLDTNPDRREFASDLGIEHVFDPADGDVLDQIAKLTGRGGADVTIETSGNVAGRSLALDALRKWGTAVFVGFGGTCSFDVVPQIIQRQITIRGSWMFSMSGLIDALDHADRHDVGLERVITKSCTIDEAPAAIQEFAAGASGKTVVEWK